MAAASEEVTLTLGGMHCAACVARVERALGAVHGVDQALVNLATRRARVRFDPGRASLEALKEAVHQAGYEVEEVAREHRDYLEWMLRQDFPADARRIVEGALRGEFPDRPVPGR